MSKKLKPLQQSAKDLIFCYPSVEGSTIDLATKSILFCKQILEKNDQWNSLLLFDIRPFKWKAQ